LSTFGRRGSRESGWNWSRPPAGPGRPPPTLPLLPLAGAALLFVAIATALLAVWLSDGDESSPQDATATPVASATATRTPTPAPTATATPIPSPTPTPTPAAEGPVFRLGAWDEHAWRFDPSLDDDAYRKSGNVPFVLRIDRARPGATYPLVIRYGCRGFAFLTAYGRNSDSAPAIASGGPGSVFADSAAPIPDDPATAADDGEDGSLSLWGGSFAGAAVVDPPSPCLGEKRLFVEIAPAADTVFLMWAAHVSDAASAGGVPLRLAVQVPGQIDPVVVGTPPP